MCGFVGCSPQCDEIEVSVCLARIAHRGPDARRVLRTPQATLGHARLSILDVAEGHQPMMDEQNWIVFNGEIYNYEALRTKFDLDCGTDSDTEVLLKLFQSQGPEAFPDLDGMFSFVISGKDLMMGRDPVGIKPLYFAHQDGRTYFASEVKALLPVAEDIQEFPAGMWWHSQTGLARFYDFERYKQPSESIQPVSPRADDFERIQRVLTEAVHKRLIADPDVPVGVSLSGGLDSSLIAALASQAKSPLETFVVGMPGSEDVERSRLVSRYLGTRHHVYLYTFDEMLAVLPEVIYYLESYDAALVRSAIPNFFLSRLAAQHVKVILTGEGADELFGGYEYLRDIRQPGLLQEELWEITANLHHTNLQRTDRMTMAHGIEGRVPFLDRQVIELAFTLPPAWKLIQPDKPEKSLLREAFAGFLPEEILQRPKQKFSSGAGSADRLAEYAHGLIAQDEFNQVRHTQPELGLRSREELLYYRIFRDMFGEKFPVRLVGRTRSVTTDELQ